MIPIKEAITTRAWLHCEVNYNYELFQFRIKILSFRKLNLSEVDEPEKIDFKDANTIIWIMDVEVVNLTKEPISTRKMELLEMVDQDGFKFPKFYDGHLCISSNFAKKSGLYRLVGDSLLPKIKAIGAIPFLLPDDEAVYSISISGGSIKEV